MVPPPPRFPMQTSHNSFLFPLSLLYLFSWIRVNLPMIVSEMQCFRFLRHFTLFRQSKVLGLPRHDVNEMTV